MQSYNASHTISACVRPMKLETVAATTAMHEDAKTALRSLYFTAGSTLLAAGEILLAVALRLLDETCTCMASRQLE